jgi:hypothetical protein
MLGMMRPHVAALVVLAVLVAASSSAGALERSVALPGIPAYAQDFRSWTKINRRPIPPRESGDPHLGTKNVYVNRPRSVLLRAGKQRFPYPNGTIVVKSARRPTKPFIGLVAIMRKVKGSDGAHGDWKFVEYTRESANARFRPIAADGVCWSCHVGARKSDWVFTVFK